MFAWIWETAGPALAVAALVGCSFALIKVGTR